MSEAPELTEREIGAIMATGDQAGAYLDHLGKTDLATMTEPEWLGFIEAVVMAYADEMASRHAPYAVLRSRDDPTATESAGYRDPVTGPIRPEEVPY